MSSWRSRKDRVPLLTSTVWFPSLNTSHPLMGSLMPVLSLDKTREAKQCFERRQTVEMASRGQDNAQQ